MDAEFNSRLIKNILNSPFASLTSDGTESGLTENYLFFIRQLYNPVNNSKFNAYSKLFGSIINLKDKSIPEKRRRELLFQYEQYFSRIELLNLVIKHESTIRQLINTHLIKIPHIKQLLIKNNLIQENNNICLSIFNLLHNLIDVQLTNSVNKNRIKSFVDVVRNEFVEPLIIIRHGISHGFMRAFIDAKGKKNLPSNKKDKYFKANEIFRDIDSVSYYMISRNYNLIHKITYNWLLLYKSKNFRKDLLLELKNDSVLYNKGLHQEPIYSKEMINNVINFKNEPLKKICFNPYQKWDLLMKHIIKI